MNSLRIAVGKIAGMYTKQHTFVKLGYPLKRKPTMVATSSSPEVNLCCVYIHNFGSTSKITRWSHHNRMGWLVYWSSCTKCWQHSGSFTKSIVISRFSLKTFLGGSIFFWQLFRQHSTLLIWTLLEFDF